MQNTSVQSSHKRKAVEDRKAPKPKKTKLKLTEKVIKDGKAPKSKKSEEVRKNRNGSKESPMDVKISKKKKSTKTDKSSKLVRLTKRKEVGTKVAVEKVPIEDLVAWSNFGIPDQIMEAISEQGFIKPTEIQQLTLAPALLGRRDILGAAETGSGKTLAFGIPIVAGILDLKRNQIDINKLDKVRLRKPRFFCFQIKFIVRDPN